MTDEEISALIMNADDEYSYISDLQTYDLIYLNKSAKQLFNMENDEYKDYKCYKLLQGKDAPCDFCINHKLKQGEFYRWVHYNKILNKYLALKDTLVDIEGYLYHLQMSNDITKDQKELNALRNQLSIEETTIRCIKTLTEEKDINQAIHKLLSIIGDFHKANRAYIFEFNKENTYIYNTYEWCAKGVSKEIDNLQEIPIEVIANWIKMFEKEGEFYISSLQKDIKENALEYQILEAQGIDSLMAAPLKKDGKIIGFLGVDNPSENINNSYLLHTVPLFILDDLDKRRMINELERQSYIDTLTDLYNRNKYNQVIKSLQKSNLDSVGIMYADLNGLKYANDTYGHEYGDYIIGKTAKLLKKHFNDCIYRIGGDEFICICPNIEKADFDKKLEAIRRTLEIENEFSLSIGQIWTQEIDDIVKQIQYCDELMYIDKQRYYTSIKANQNKYRSVATKKLLGDIKNHRFTILLQPKVELHTRKVISGEALVRYIDDDGQLVAPDQFIPIYEKDGIIRYIDFFVLEVVCQTLQQWRKLEYDTIPIAVNLSRITLLEYDIVNHLLEICKKYNVEPSCIQLEITESVRNIDIKVMQKIVKDLMDVGFLISLDDFGAKYANLSILSSMDFNEIKFDKSLIDSLMSNDKSKIIIEHTIDMCNTFDNTSTLAEGIETEEQMQLLKYYNCLKGQGFLFSKPLSISEFIKFYNNNNNINSGYC